MRHDVCGFRGVAGWLVQFTLVVLLPACRGSTDPVPQSVWTALAASEPYTCGLSLGAEAFCWGWVPGYYYGPLPRIPCLRSQPSRGVCRANLALETSPLVRCLSVDSMRMAEPIAGARIRWGRSAIVPTSPSVV